MSLCDSDKAAEFYIVPIKIAVLVVNICLCFSYGTGIDKLLPSQGEHDLSLCSHDLYRSG